MSEITFESPVEALPGVGPERRDQLARLGIERMGDLLWHRPRRYEDRRQWRTLGEVRELGPVAIRGKVVALGVKYFRKRTRSVFELILEDGTGRLHCRWWNLPFLAAHYGVGQELMVYGRVIDLKPRTMDHPEVEVVEAGDEGSVHMDRIVPVYPLTEGMSQRWLRGCLWRVLQQWGGAVGERHAGVERTGMPTREEALRALHFPETLDAIEPARRRLAYDEFVEMQVEIQGRRRRLLERAPGRVCGGDNRWMRPFLQGLKYRLTESQLEVLREIRRDLASGRPMRRLVQGDVGTGKTVVAAAAALMVAESGYSVAMMAPTEILARQHAARFGEWFEPLGIGVRLWTGSRKSSGAREEGEEGESGEGVKAEAEAEAGARPTMTVGTHALIQRGFTGDRLGLVIIDEQHKFGVGQREELLRKGECPHLLVMTATPIPRTLALTLYGDLEVSVIRAGPPGRGRIRTFVRGPDRLPRVWEFVRGEVGMGRQAYVVVARVDEDTAGGIRALEKERSQLEAILGTHGVAALHGRMRSEEKERVLGEFRAGRVRVLVATTVVEVGVDVPEATVMVVLNAERFGLAQLHQLRGRIGRGGWDGTCVLVPEKGTEEVLARLRVLEGTSDGFEIAEADLRLRGPGELLGESQSGLPPLRFGSLVEDRELVERARRAVGQWLEAGEA